MADGSDFKLFRVPAGGGTDQRLGLARTDLRDLSVAPDGSQIAFAMGPLNRPEIWAVHNASAPQ